jgi:hypothetical protein
MTSTKIAFIAGAGRSGSTLLASLLGEIEGCTAVGEISHLWSRGLRDRELCGCGAPVDACCFWPPILKEAFPAGLPASDAVLHSRSLVSGSRQWLRRRIVGEYSRAIRKPLAEYRAVMGALYRTVAAATNARVVVDSSKFITHILPLTGTPGLTIRILHLVRDSRAVAFSLQRSRTRPHAGSARVLMNTEPSDRAAAYWLKINLMTNVLGRLNGDYLRLRYEDLLADPHVTLTKIAAFLDEQPKSLPFPLPGTALLGAQHTISGNPTRFNVGLVPLRVDDEWRHAMGEADRRAVMARTWPLMAAYGYLGR